MEIIIGELGIKIYEVPKNNSGADAYKKPLEEIFSRVDWTAERLDFQATKKEMIHSFSSFLHDRLIKTNHPG